MTIRRKTRYQHAANREPSHHYYSIVNTKKLDVLRERKLRQGSFDVAKKRSGAVYRVRIYRIKPLLVMLMKVHGKGTVDPHPDSDQDQTSVTSRGSPPAHAYHVWSTCVNAFASYLAHIRTSL